MVEETAARGGTNAQNGEHSTHVRQNDPYLSAADSNSKPTWLTSSEFDERMLPQGIKELGNR